MKKYNPLMVFSHRTWYYIFAVIAVIPEGGLTNQ